MRCNIRLELISLLYVLKTLLSSESFIYYLYSCVLVSELLGYLGHSPRDHMTSVGTMVASYPGRLTLIVFIQVTTAG